MEIFSLIRKPFLLKSLFIQLSILIYRKNIWKIYRQRQNMQNLTALSNLNLPVAPLMHRYYLAIWKQFGVDLSILSSQIDYAGGGKKFRLYIAEVEGEEEAITQTKNLFNGK